MATIMEKEKRADKLLQEAKVSAEIIQQEAHQQQEKLLADAESQAVSLREDASKTGHDEGFAAGYDEGLAKAHEECEAQLREANERAEHVMATAREEAKTYIQQSEEDITTIAMCIVEKILPQHFIDVPQVVLPLVRKAILKVKDQAEVKVHVAPDAYEMVLMARTEFQSMLEGNASLEVLSDESLQPGDCILETPNGNVDARFATQLELIKKAVQDVRL